MRLIQSGQATVITNAIPVINPIAEINGELVRFAGSGARSFPRAIVAVPGLVIIPPPPPTGVVMISVSDPPPFTPPPAGFVIADDGNMGPTSLQGTDLSNVSTLAITAHTITLMNVALPASGQSTFLTANGVLAPNPNTGAAVVPGDLNFIHNVTYQGELANTPGAGFTVGKR